MTATAEFLERPSQDPWNKRKKEQEPKMYKKLKIRVLKKIETSIVDDFVTAALEILKP